MNISRLDVADVRCIQRASLRDLGQLNLLSGSNGSGKTSVLEAIHCLSTGRSFRSRSAVPLIRRESPSLTAFAQLQGEHGEQMGLGIRRERDGSFEARLRGERVESLAELAALLPVQVVDAEAFELVAGGAGERRQFMDWGVFHVEHDFFGAWARLKRALRQRNALLRRGRMTASESAFWMNELVEAGERVDALRRAYLERLAPDFELALNRLEPELRVSLAYYRGWDASTALADALHQREAADREAGYTALGPQRADLRLKWSGASAADHLSRGQQKLVVCALKLAQGALVDRIAGRRCIYLLDDVVAELDRHHRGTVLGTVLASGHQVFATGTEADELLAAVPAGADTRLFHVEHPGHISPVTPGSGRVATSGDAHV